MCIRDRFNGDPRQMPYKDCFKGGNDFPNSYNWYLDNLNGSLEPAIADFPSIDGTLLRNCWGSGQMACDVPRYMQLLREGLVKSSCGYSSLTGWSYFYLGIGAEVGYDAANGYPSSIPTNLTPYGLTGSTGYFDNITSPRR